MIKKLDLTGSWHFAMDPAKEGIKTQQHLTQPEDTISLPGTTSQAKKGTPSDLRETGCLTDPWLFEGYAWYSRDISLEDEDLGKNIFLYLERTRMTKIWIDDIFEIGRAHV